MRVLYELEELFPVRNWSVGGIELWPLLRLRWFFGEWAAHYTPQHSGTVAGPSAAKHLRNVATGALKARWTTWRDACRTDRGPTQRDLVFLSDGLSFANLGGFWVERFCDPLAALAARRGLDSTLWTPLHRYYQPRFTASRFVQPGVDRANLAGVLRAGGAAATSRLSAHREVVDALAARGFGSSTLRLDKIASDGSRVRAVADHYRRHLERVRPRLAFLVSYYSLEGMAFVLACRESGIPVVDIQHGVQGDMHPAYAAWSRPIQGNRHALLPDRFWVWSDWEHGTIDRWSRGTGHAAVVGGNPWMSVWQDGSAWPGVDRALMQAQALRERANGKPVILVTLQFGLSQGEQIDPLADLIREAGGRLAFWVRLHPAMLERREEVRARLAGAGPIELDECTDLPLQALLPWADLHLTHSSSTVIEAAQFGVPSVLTTAYGGELFGPLLESGWASVVVPTATRLASTLENLAAAGRRQPENSEAPANAALQSLLAVSALPSAQEPA
jgi:hypothetical protein